MLFLLPGCGSSAPTGGAAGTDPAALTGATWRLNDTSLGALVASPPADIAVTIEFADGQASGNSGCNAYGGGYTAKSDGSIDFEQFRVTLMACPDPQASVESAYLAALAKVTTFSVGDTLSLTGGGVSMSYSKEASPSPPPLIGTAWTLSAMSSGGTTSSTTTSANPITMTLASDATVSGSAGCNAYHGGYTTQGDSLTFEPLATTRKLCEPDVMSQEQSFLTAMGNVATFAVDGSQLTMSDSSGAALLTFVGPP
jgi:heat shock protein HslJ